MVEGLDDDPSTTELLLGGPPPQPSAREELAGKHLVHPPRHELPRLPRPALVEQIAAEARLEVDLDAMRPTIARGLHEAGRRIDRPRRPDGHEQVTSPQRLVDALHL